jgi:hypothetical protein
MTAVAKLVFGSDYDKARLTEYAAALSYAARQEVAGGGFLEFIEGVNAHVTSFARPGPGHWKRLQGMASSRWCLSAAMPMARWRRSQRFPTLLCLSGRCARRPARPLARQGLSLR